MVWQVVMLLVVNLLTKRCYVGLGGGGGSKAVLSMVVKHRPRPRLVTLGRLNPK